MKLIFLIIMSFVTVAFSRSLDVCRYRGKQMTMGQKLETCHAVIMCYAGGIIKRQNSCPQYSCSRPSKMNGYKAFDPKKPYPSCCGGPICEDKLKYYYYIPESS